MVQQAPAEFVTGAVVIADETFYERNRLSQKLLLAGVKVLRTVDVSKKNVSYDDVDLVVILKSNVGHRSTVPHENTAERAGKPLIFLQHNVSDPSWEKLRVLKDRLVAQKRGGAVVELRPETNAAVAKLSEQLAQVQQERDQEKERANKLALSQAAAIKDRDQLRKDLALLQEHGEEKESAEVEHLTERLRVADERERDLKKRIKEQEATITRQQAQRAGKASEEEADILSLYEQLDEAKREAEEYKRKFSTAQGREAQARSKLDPVLARLEEVEKKLKEAQKDLQKRESAAPKSKGPDMVKVARSLLDLVEAGMMSAEEALRKVAGSKS